MKFMKLSKMKFPSPLLIRLSDLFINVTSWRRGLSSRFYENKRRYDDDLFTQTKVRSVDQLTSTLGELMSLTYLLTLRIFGSKTKIIFYVFGKHDYGKHGGNHWQQRESATKFRR